MTTRDAIASHVRWKITLLLAVRMREPLSDRALQSIQYPEQCSLGKWLLGKHTLHLRSTKEYLAAVDGHQAFHRQMLAIAHLINSRKFDEAERLLNFPGPFISASNSFANAIMALDRIPNEDISPDALRI
ncbi:MAG TPA: CZB domain-containing protein [Acidobacteriaceae bacterium]